MAKNDKKMCRNCDNREVYEVKIAGRSSIWLHNDNSSSVCRHEKGYTVSAVPEVF